MRAEKKRQLIDSGSQESLQCKMLVKISLEGWPTDRQQNSGRQCTGLGHVGEVMQELSVGEASCGRSPVFVVVF